MLTKKEAIVAYDKLVQYRKQNILIKSKENPGKIEVHHIIPISIGGLDDDLNKIALLAKEHFMAHVYLFIIHHDDEFHNQMTCALMNMHKGTINGDRKELREYILMSEEYQLAREEFGKLISKQIPSKISGNKNGMHGKHWIRNPQTREYKIISENEQLPDGWEYGKYQTMTEKSKQQVKMFSKSCKGKQKIFNPTTGEIRYINKNDKLPEGFERRGRPLTDKEKRHLKKYFKEYNEKYIKPKCIEELRPMYQYYLEFGWKSCKEHFNYQYSYQNFIGLCKRYLPEFKSNQKK